MQFLCLFCYILYIFIVYHQFITHIYIEEDYCENVYISADMQIDQKKYLKISKNLIYGLHMKTLWDAKF
jgi:hypothetical protein